MKHQLYSCYPSPTSHLLLISSPHPVSLPPGDLIHQVSQSASQSYPQTVFLGSPSPPSTFTSTDKEQIGILLDPSPSSPEPHPLRVAAKAYSLSSVLMMILMHGRVLNEEPLILRGAEIAATGKLADPQSLLCYHDNRLGGGVCSAAY